MVKNTGGKRTKGVARKNENSASAYSKIRISECEQEKYAIVRKIFGGSRCEVFCDDLISRQAIIRGKFSGRNKRRNIIQVGTILLIGIRDWVTHTHDKIQESDVLEVYSSLEFDQLKQKPNFPILFIESNNNNINNNIPNDSFSFSLFDTPDSLPTPSISTSTFDNNIDFDDI